MEALLQGMAGGIASHRNSGGALLSLDGVTVTRLIGGERVVVLDAVSFAVDPGEFVAITGGRRAGKTALLRVAAGVEPPRSGTVRVRGRRITNVPGGARARRTRVVGYMPKELQLAEGKRVADHVALPLLADRVPLATATARAHEALDLLGAIDLAGALPHELSGGQRATVALARALVRRPALLLADEPGAKAEHEDRDHLLRLLRKISRERSDLGVVLTTRDEAGSSGATRVLSLNDGRLTDMAHTARVIPLPARSR